MQPPSIHAIRDRLLQGLDKDYNVVDMGIVVEVISQLESYAITKEALEATRLGKHINELRRKASDKQLASRAKSLVKKWRELLMPSSGTATPVQTSTEEPSAVVPPVQPNMAMANAMAQRLTNGHHNHRSTPSGIAQASSQPSSRLTSPAVSSSSRLSPGLSTPGGHGGSNLGHTTRMPISSSSMPSSASSSPGLSRPTTPNNHNSRPVSPAVPKTNAANKRLRKEMLEDGDNVEIVNNDNDLHSPAAKKAKISSNHSRSPPILLNGSVKSTTTKRCDSNTIASNGHHTKILDQDSEMNYVRDRTTNSLPMTPSGTTIEDPMLTPSKANNKRVSRKKQLEQEREHLLEQKLLTARRQASKVRTTQELVQELALRSSTPTGPVKSSSVQMVSETKTELMNRFFESQNGNGNNQHSDVLSPPLSDGPPSPSNMVKDGLKTAQNATFSSSNNDSNKESVEDILAQLPPIDVASILAEINSEMQVENSSNQDDSGDISGNGTDMEESDQEEIEGLIPPVKKTRQKINSNSSSSHNNNNKKEQLSDGVKAAMVDELHAGQHESVNGNFDHDGAFKEWHEVVTKETVNGDLLYILPYSVID